MSSVASPEDKLGFAGWKTGECAQICATIREVNVAAAEIIGEEGFMLNNRVIYFPIPRHSEAFFSAPEPQSRSMCGGYFFYF